MVEWWSGGAARQTLLERTAHEVGAGLASLKGAVCLYQGSLAKASSFALRASEDTRQPFAMIRKAVGLQGRGAGHGAILRQFMSY